MRSSLTNCTIIEENSVQALLDPLIPHDDRDASQGISAGIFAQSAPDKRFVQIRCNQHGPGIGTGSWTLITRARGSHYLIYNEAGQ